MLYLGGHIINVWEIDKDVINHEQLEFSSDWNWVALFFSTQLLCVSWLNVHFSLADCNPFHCQKALFSVITRLKLKSRSEKDFEKTQKIRQIMAQSKGAMRPLVFCKKSFSYQTWYLYDMPNIPLFLVGVYLLSILGFIKLSTIFFEVEFFRRFFQYE